MEKICWLDKIKQLHQTTGIVHALRDTHHTQTVVQHLKNRTE